MTKEVWKPVLEYKGIEVSNFGNVKRNSVLCKKYLTTSGYELVYIGIKEGKTLNKIVHRLVAMAFLLDKKSEGLEINHINGIKTDNRVENLEWCTKSENQKHAFRTGLNKPNIKKGDNHKKIWKKVSQYTRNMEFIRTFDSILIAGNNTGINPNDISSVSNGKRKTAGGFIWIKEN